MHFIKKLFLYPRDDIWRSRVADLKGFRSFRVKFLRILILSLRDFFGYQVRASTLTYYSLLSVVPFFALIFGIAKGFGYEKNLRGLLMQRLHGQEQVVSKITSFAHSLLEHTQSGLIAGIGVVFIFYSVVNVLMNIEDNFNYIWHIHQGRFIKRKISDYLSFMLIGPVLFIIASTITVLFTTEIKLFVRKIDFLGTFSPAILLALRFTPYLTIWLLFTFMYVFMPNTKVRFTSGLLAGFIAGSFFQIFQWIYVTFQIGVSRYNAIYGSLAALPIFLIWLQLSWVIILIGAAISYAHQNTALYDYEPDCKNISSFYKRILDLVVVRLLIKGFEKGEKLWDEDRISEALRIPRLLLRPILQELERAGIISRVKTDEASRVVFQPGRSTENLTVLSVVKALETQGRNNIPEVNPEEVNKFQDIFEALADRFEQSSLNKRLGSV